LCIQEYSYRRQDEEDDDFSLISMIILRLLQCRPLLLVFLPSYWPPCCFQHSRAYSYTLAYPAVLTIVHYDGTYILSLHTMYASDLVYATEAETLGEDSIKPTVEATKSKGRTDKMYDSS
jgi:hypothetical protein